MTELDVEVAGGAFEKAFALVLCAFALLVVGVGVAVLMVVGLAG